MGCSLSAIKRGNIAEPSPPVEEDLTIDNFFPDLEGMSPKDFDISPKYSMSMSPLSNELKVDNFETAENELFEEEYRIEGVFNHVTAKSTDSDYSPTIDIIEKTPEQSELIKTVLLANQLLFADLEEDEIQLIIAAMIPQQVIVGEIIIQEGEEAHYFYIIEKGFYDIRKGDHVIGTLLPGTSFGEMAIISNSSRFAAVRARTPGNLFKLEAGCFWYIISHRRARRVVMVADCLSRIPCLSHVPREGLYKFAEGADIVKYKEGDVILEKDVDDGDVFYCIKDGIVLISDLPGFIDHERETGAVFGQKELTSGVCRASNVTAITDVEVICLDRKSIMAEYGPMNLIKENDRKYGIINNIEFMCLLEENIKELLIKAFRIEDYHPGLSIVTEGQEIDKLYVVKTGIVTLIHEGDVIGSLSIGQYFGEASLLGDEFSQVTVVTETHCKFYVLQRDHFECLAGKQSRRTSQMQNNWINRRISDNEDSYHSNNRHDGDRIKSETEPSDSDSDVSEDYYRRRRMKVRIRRPAVVLNTTLI